MIRLPALNQRITPTIMGKVVYLSADALSDRQSHGQAESRKACRSWRISTSSACGWTRTTCAAGSGRFVPTPGMPADVYIKTGERTFFEYIMRPIYDSLSRAFRES